jgi:hypothetical protein
VGFAIVVEVQLTGFLLAGFLLAGFLLAVFEVVAALAEPLRLLNHLPQLAQQAQG